MTKKEARLTVYVTQEELASLKHRAVDERKPLTKYVRIKLGLDKEKPK